MISLHSLIVSSGYRDGGRLPQLSFLCLVLLSTSQRALSVGAEPVTGARTQYQTRKIADVEIRISDAIYQLDKKTRSEILNRLESTIGFTFAKVPKQRLALVMQSQIWVDYDVAPGAAARRKQIRGPAYHIPKDLETDGRRGGVVINGDLALTGQYADYLAAWTKCWLLHEIGHVCHDRRLGRESADVLRAYQAAMDARLYEKTVGRVPTSFTDLALIDRDLLPNARTNQYEYFAELSVAFLAENYTFPHNRKELAKHDARGYEMMKKAWEAE